MIAVANDEIAAIFAGEMRIKSIRLGEKIVYTRPGGYVYIELDMQKER
ncbi:MAG: hypothetical protein KH420_06345 [Clostridiales bacterium]|nr:hypothetical protein [Clostridiales bacterium]